VSEQYASQLRVLRILESNPGVSQRQLAIELGISLGKTHYLLRALLAKGVIKTENFRRSDNKLAYLYLLTPHGIAEKVHLTRTYLAIKEREYESIRGEIEQLRKEVGTCE
jgi:EPS-associated MarR family transcriptional regulator